LSAEETFVFCALRGTTDAELLDDLLKLEKKTLKDIENAANLYESKLVSRAKLNSKQDAVMKISPSHRQHRSNANARPKPKQKSDPPKSKRPPTRPARPSTIREMKEQGLCTRCGKSGHEPIECSYERDVICNHCGIRGHISPACLGRTKVNAIEKRSPSPSSCSEASD
ncbi:hypothetical protein COA94_08935, partial, partial [Paramuricea clavata]